MRDIEWVADYYDTETECGSDYRIAEFVLGHITELEDMSTADVAQGAFVSKATVSRFVRKLGFENYEHFMRAVRDYNHGSRMVNLRLNSHEMQLVTDSPSEFFDSYVTMVQRSLDQLAQAVDPLEVEHLIREMLASPTAFFAFDQPLLLAKELQMDLLRKGCLVKLGQNHNKRVQIADSLEAGSLAVVFSNYGAYVQENNAMLQSLHARGVKLWLITLCYAGPDSLYFDHVTRLTPEPYSNAGIHPMKVLVEYIIRRLAVL
jgi:DNA-binding MurR/RpiR family transcriptional regulator